MARRRSKASAGLGMRLRGGGEAGAGAAHVRRPACLRPRSELPIDALELVFRLLPAETRKNASLVSNAFALAVRRTWRTAVVDASRPARFATLPASLAPLVEEVAVVGGPGDVEMISLARSYETEEGRLRWRESGRAPDRSGELRHLRQLASSFTLATASRSEGQARRLSLVLPGRRFKASQVDGALREGAAGALFSGVAVLDGRLELDGGLPRTLTSVHTCYAMLPRFGQLASQGLCYHALRDLTLHIDSASPEDMELPGRELSVLTPAALPALRSLALHARSPAADYADAAQTVLLSFLQHPGIAHLHLQNVLLPAGFADVAQLAGLESLALLYEGDEGEHYINLLPAGLGELASLPRLSSLAVDSLASDDGLRDLPHLTRLHFAPEGDAVIELHGLRLQALCLDLRCCSDAAAGNLLRRGHEGAFVPPGTGLPDLRFLEIRQLSWPFELGFSSLEAGYSSASADSLDSSPDGGSSSYTAGGPGDSADSGASSASERSSAGPPASSDARSSDSGSSSSAGSAGSDSGGAPAGALGALLRPWSGGEDPTSSEPSDESSEELSDGKAAGPMLPRDQWLPALERRYLARLVARFALLERIVLSECLQDAPIETPHGAEVGVRLAGRLWGRVCRENEVPGGSSTFHLEYRLLGGTAAVAE